MLVRISRANLLTRMQEWDYYLGIAAVKRLQGLFQSTLVAQGAFSIYRTERVRAIGGWPDAIGEDIVGDVASHGDRRPHLYGTDGRGVHRRAHRRAPLHAPACAVGPRDVRGIPRGSPVAPGHRRCSPRWQASTCSSRSWTSATR